MDSPSHATDKQPLQARLRGRCRSIMLERLAEFARGLGFAHDDWLERFVEAAGQAHDELAGLHDRRGFERAHGLTASRISLVHEHDLEFTLELTALARRLRERCGAELVRLHQRYMTLLHQRDAAAEQTPVGPEAVCSALRALSNAAGFDAEQRLRFLERCAEPLGHTLHALYRELNAAMEAEGITLQAPGRPQPPRPAASAAATPAAPRPAAAEAPPPAPANPAGSLARVFDALPRLDDLSPALLERLQRLQAPLRRLAQTDPRLLADATHPVRGVLQGALGIGLSLGADCATEQADCRKLLNTLDTLAGDRSPGREPYARALPVLEALRETRCRAAETLAEQAIPLAERAERREHSLLQATHLINRLSTADTPGAVRSFLARTWLPLLARLHYNHGDGHPQWRSCAELADRLLRSAHPPTDPHGRSRWVGSLPALVRELNQGLTALGMDEAARAAALAPCMDLHAALLTGRPAPDFPAPPAEAAMLSAPVGPNGLRLLNHGGYSGTAIGNHPAATAGPGAWLAVNLADGDSLRGCVAWTGATQRVVILAAPDQPRVLVVTRRALAELAARGDCRLLDAGGWLERLIRDTADRGAL